MPAVSARPNAAPAGKSGSGGGDLYSKMKVLQRQLEFLEIQEEYIKDEMQNLKRELGRAKEEVKRIQSVPLVIGQFLEIIDRHHGIVSSTTGSNYYVRILSTINRELLKPGASVALHRHSNAVVDVLPPEADSAISMLGADEKPNVSYNDIGGCASKTDTCPLCPAPLLSRLCPWRPHVSRRADARPRSVCVWIVPSAAATSRSRRFARPWSCPSRTTTCTRRLALTRLAESCSTALRGRARRCWQRRWRTTRRRRSSASSGASSCRNTSERARAWSATCARAPFALLPLPGGPREATV